MDVIDIAKRSLFTAWNNKKLWLFGLFVASSSSSGGNGGDHSAAPLSSAEALPGWLWPARARPGAGDGPQRAAAEGVYPGPDL